MKDETFGFLKELDAKMSKIDYVLDTTSVSHGIWNIKKRKDNYFDIVRG